MKKRLTATVFAVITLVAALFCASCGGTTDYFSYVSELRSNVFCGEAEDYSVTIYSGMREKPFKHDGAVGELGFFAAIKIFMNERSDESVKIELVWGENRHERQTDYDPVSSALSCFIELSELPENAPQITITRGENSIVIQTKSLMAEDSITYLQALKKATEKAADFLKENSTSSGFNGEISLRLLCENEKNYYYVGFILPDGLKLAYLLDAKTGEILAEKKL